MIGALERRSPSVPRAAGLFAGRDLTVALSYKAAFAMSIASVAMSLVTFHFIAKLVGPTQLNVAGGYFSFVVIGLAMSQILDGAVSAPAAQVRQEQVQGTLEVLATTPMRPAALAAGWIAYPLANGMVVSLAMLLMAGPMGLRFTDPNWIAALTAVLLAAAAFAGLGIVIAALVLVIQQAGALTKWLTAGMGLLSGVFFKMELFPKWVQVIAQASPLTHAVAAMRGALLASKDRPEGHLAALAVFAAVLLPASVAALSLALRRARARGTISTY
jgi:ABC-type polysaccharide/polyol phosphate export permease